MADTLYSLIGQLLCVGIPIGVLVLFLVINEQGNKRRRQELANALAEYQGSLQHLKRDPANADLKQKTLALGRSYSSLTRQRKGATVYDEMALMNDISAATAAAAVPIKQPVEERLRSLDDLKVKGIISDQEYATRRQQILGEV